MRIPRYDGMRWGLALLASLTLGFPGRITAQGMPQDSIHGHGTPVPTAPTAPAPKSAPRRTEPWSERTLELFESMPVQDGGRIKPMHTYAGFTLLRLHGKRSLETPAGETLGPAEWLLDTFFFPEQAAEYPLFLVQDSAVLEGAGLRLEDHRKRDRYSFDELGPRLSRFLELAHEYGRLDPKERSTVQQQTVDLAEGLNTFLHLGRHFDFARAPFRVGPGERLANLLDGRTSIEFSELVPRAHRLSELHGVLSVTPGADRGEDMDSVARLLNSAMDLASPTARLALIPPTGTVADEPAWWTPAELLSLALAGSPVPGAQVELLGDLEGLARQRLAPLAFETQLEQLVARSTALAEARGEGDRLGAELFYYRSKVIGRSLVAFVLAFLAVALQWMMPRNRKLYGVAWITAGLGTLGLIAAIVLRCWIRSRPPVSTLYETLLFVTATGALLALAIEWIDRRRLGLSAAAVVGLVGLFLANGYETLDKQDTMPSLVAVLDTNFWLATHVTAITLGYSAGMLAALLASGYLLAKLVGWKRGDRSFYRPLGRMVYGVLCFALIFSTVGTILGGIWANESWGRFWGWDPKENGALLIVISQLAILHGRAGGYLREHGICMAAAFGGTVIAFSWWGVNLLGVGLHSYGFTSGIHRALWGYYGLQWAIVGLGAIAGHREAMAKALEEARRGGVPKAQQEGRDGPADSDADGSSQNEAEERRAAA